jgi:hypothetical protein
MSARQNHKEVELFVMGLRPKPRRPDRRLRRLSGRWLVMVWLWSKQRRPDIAASGRQKGATRNPVPSGSFFD